MISFMREGDTKLGYRIPTRVYLDMFIMMREIREYK